MKKRIPKGAGLAGAVFLAVLVLLLCGFIWVWGFCRFYVPPGHMAVVTAKLGKPLPPGQILAGKGQKGIQEDVLAEGRYFLNPVLYERRIVPLTTIEPGQVGIVTSKVGKALPPGAFLADPGSKGIWKRVLGPGKYRLNPEGYRIEIVSAINIPIGYVGVLTSLAGKQAPEGHFAGKGEKGVRKDVLQPGLYYVNPKAFKTDVLEVGVNQISLLGREKRSAEIYTKSEVLQQNVAMQALQREVLDKQRARRASYFRRERAEEEKAERLREAVRGRPLPTVKPQGVQPLYPVAQFVEFPSRDGFEILLDMTVEFELLPENIASIFLRIGDLPAVVEKIILPQILSISRLKGSAYRAKDFIVGEGREKFQRDLTAQLKKTLKEKQIEIHNALIRHVGVPEQILKPIQAASVAVEQNLTNIEKQATAKKLAELNTETSLIAQKSEQVQQETEKLKAEIRANQEKEVAEIRAETLKRVSKIEKETAAVQAERKRKLGKADADILRMVEGARAEGFRLKVEAFRDPQAYTTYEFARGLKDDLSVAIVHAGTGTLWTDLEKAGLTELGGAKILQGKER